MVIIVNHVLFFMAIGGHFYKNNSPLIVHRGRLLVSYIRYIGARGRSLASYIRYIGVGGGRLKLIFYFRLMLTKKSKQK